mmetsp:Transcript_35643/g.89590  ORF Transcript_35643/g.89590 Transcript_35643/m.89590 type:complete len:250 (+) Transcript_35643:182-931(+)
MRMGGCVCFTARTLCRSARRTTPPPLASTPPTHSPLRTPTSLQTWAQTSCGWGSCGRAWSPPLGSSTTHTCRWYAASSPLWVTATFMSCWISTKTFLRHRCVERASRFLPQISPQRPATPFFPRWATLWERARAFTMTTACMSTRQGWPTSPTASAPPLDCYTQRRKYRPRLSRSTAPPPCRTCLCATGPARWLPWPPSQPSSVSTSSTSPGPAMCGITRVCSYRAAQTACGCNPCTSGWRLRCTKRRN